MSNSAEVIGKQSVMGVISYTVRTVFLYVVAVVATGFLSAFLTPTEFGVYFVVLSVIGIFTFFSDVGLAASLIQQKAEPTIEQLRAVFSVQLLLAAAILLATIILEPVWSSQGLSNPGKKLLYALSFSFVLASLKTVPSILLERRLEFSKLVVPQIVEQLVFYALAVILATRGWGIHSFTIAVYLRSIAGVVTIYLIQQWPIGWHLTKKTLSGLLPFGLKFQANDLLARLKDDLYVVVMARFLSPYDIGLLGWAKRWSMFPYQFAVNSVVSVTFPTMARIQDDPGRITNGLEKAWFYISILIFPLLMGMWLMAYPVVALIPRLNQWQGALIPLGLFCANIALAALANPAITVLNATGKISFTLRLMIGMTVATWAATPLALRLFGYVGVAVTAVVSAALSLYAIYYLNRFLNFRFFKNVTGALLATFFMSVVLWLGRGLWHRSIAWIGMGIVVAVATYLLSIWVLERRRILSEVGWLAHKLRKS